MRGLFYNWSAQLPVLSAGLVASFAVMVVGAPAQAQDLGGGEATADVEDDDSEAPERADDDTDDAEADETPPGREVTPSAQPVQRDDEVRESTRRQIEGAQTEIPVQQIAEEMIDELVADLETLNTGPLRPAAVRRISLSPNLAPEFGEFVESTLVTAVANHTDVTVKRCVACTATRSMVQDDNLVVTQGMVEQQRLAREADRLGADTFLDTRFSFNPDANVAAMQVEFFRADDGTVLWSETYRSDATTAAILRSGDRVVERQERVRELERRIDERPYYGHQVGAGFAYIPYDSPEGGIGGMMGSYRLYEHFGENRQFLYAIGADGFANFREGNELMGAFVYGTLQAEIFEPNLNDPTFRTGPAVGGFVAGTEGNSFVAEWTADAIFQFRLGAGASLFYFVPTEFAGNDLGGFGLKGRVSFNW